MNVSVQMISNIERGNKAVRIENLVRLCDVLKISTDYILTGKRTDNDFDTLTEKISRLTESDYKMIEMLVDYRLSENNKNKRYEDFSPYLFILPNICVLSRKG